MTEPTITASFTRQELQTLAWAASSLVLERRGRGLGHPLDQPYPEPTEVDLCCDFHTEDYARRKRQHDALLERGNCLGTQRLRHNEQAIWDNKIGPLLDELTIPD